MTSKKVKQARAPKVKKTTFSMDEYDKSTVALGFIQAALDVTLQLNDPDDVLPILCEAAGKTMELYLLIKSMSPAEVTA